MDSKADVGLGSLIIFISLTMVVAIAVGVAYQNTEAIGQAISSQSQRGRADISTALVGMELTAEGKKAHQLDTFNYRIKMAPADGFVEFEDMVLMLHSGNFTNTLSFGGTQDICRNSIQDGYNTIEEEEVDERIPVFDAGFFDGQFWGIGADSFSDLDIDFDRDNVKDGVAVCADGGAVSCPAEYEGTSLVFNLSRDGMYYVKLYNDDGSVVNLSDGDPFRIERLEFGDYGYITGWRDDANNPPDITGMDENIDFTIYGNTVDLEEDIDNDGQVDEIATNRTHIYLFLSSLDSPLTYSLDTNINETTTIDVEHTITDGSETYGTLSVEGTTTTPDVIDPEVDVIITPLSENIGKGTYCVSYDSMSSQDIENGMESGDVATIAFESSEPLGESETAELILSHKVGHTHRVEFETPNVIHDESYTLYP